MLNDSYKWPSNDELYGGPDNNNTAFLSDQLLFIYLFIKLRFYINFIRQNVDRYTN